jgi:hypothetical protein
MPNNITNRLEFTGISSVVSELIENFSTYNGKIFTFPDFNKIIPMPENLCIESSTMGEAGVKYLIENSENRWFKKELVKPSDEAIELGKKYLHNIADYGFKNWYDWAISNWETKWNAYECCKIAENVYEFETAWSCVKSLINIISKIYPKVEIMYKWCDEDTGSNCGFIKYLNGEIERKFFDNQSKEAYEFCFELKKNKDDYKFVNGKYEYIEEE